MILRRDIFHHVKGRLDTAFVIGDQGLDNPVIFNKVFDSSASKLAPVFTSQLIQRQLGTVNIKPLSFSHPLIA